MEEMRKIALMDDDAFADFIGIKTKYMDANFVMLEAKSESVTKCAFWKIETEDVEDYEIDETIRDIEEDSEILKEHEEFQKGYNSYGQYIQGTRALVLDRGELHDSNLRRNIPRNKKFMTNLDDLALKYEKVPEIQNDIKKEHDENLRGYDGNCEMLTTYARDYYHREKEVLEEIMAKESEIQKEIDGINKSDMLIEQCNNLIVDIEEIETADVPLLGDANSSLVFVQESLDSSIADQREEFEVAAKEVAALEEKLEALDNQHNIHVDNIRMNERKIEELLKKASYNEIEADDTFEDVVKTDFYEQDKQAIMQLKIDNIQIQNDLKHVKGLIVNLEMDIASIDHADEQTKIKEQTEVIKRELSDMVDEESAMTLFIRNIETEIAEEEDKIDKELTNSIEILSALKELKTKKIEQLHRRLDKAMKLKKEVANRCKIFRAGNNGNKDLKRPSDDGTLESETTKKVKPNPEVELDDASQSSIIEASPAAITKSPVKAVTKKPDDAVDEISVKTVPKKPDDAIDKSPPNEANKNKINAKRRPQAEEDELESVSPSKKEKLDVDFFSQIQALVDKNPLAIAKHIHCLSLKDGDDDGNAQAQLAALFESPSTPFDLLLSQSKAQDKTSTPKRKQFKEQSEASMNRVIGPFNRFTFTHYNKKKQEDEQDDALNSSLGDSEPADWSIDSMDASYTELSD